MVGGLQGEVEEQREFSEAIEMVAGSGSEV